MYWRYENICAIIVHSYTIGGDMSLLRLALEKQRWDLAAYTIVLAAARLLKQGGADGGKNGRKKRLKAPAK
jgi:hypothetical protein